MRSIEKLLSYSFVFCLLLSGLTPLVQAQNTFEAYLSGSNEVPAITTTASGSITATLDGNELTVEGSFSGLTGDYTASHIHTGMAGAAGGVLFTLDPTVDGDSRGGTYLAADNTFTLTSGQVDTLMMQGLYVNIHSGTYAGGELRGQLAPEADAHFKANLSGAFEMPAVKTMAYGGVIFQVEGDSLFVSGSFSNLSSEFDASVAGGSHLHIASAGSNGDVSILLNATVDEGKMSGVYLPSENRFELSAEQKTALMNRMFYVNIHTTGNGAGELRGQVTPNATATFYSSLSGSAEVPSIKSSATGALVLELHGDSLIATGSFTGLEGDFDASIAGGSHIHAGHAGQNGDVNILLNADVDTELRSGSYLATDNRFELTAEQKEALLGRMMYTNIHTTAFAAGELRGQVLGDASAYFITKLSGWHEIQPIWSSAIGALNVEVSGNTAIVTGGFEGLTSTFDASIAGGAHLHAGEVTANGDVEVLINTTVMEDTAGVYETGMNRVELTEEQLTVLFDEGMYANIHTTGFAAGELRGQLLFGDNMYPDSSEITSPADGSMLTIAGAATTLFEASWTESSDDNDLNYIWQLATDAEFENVIVNSSVGAETTFSADFATLDGILGDLGIEIGGTATVYHRVIVSDGSNETVSEPMSAMLERGTLTSSETVDEPNQFGLDQNYPNPFNPTTSISFTLSENSNATLRVFNLLGQEVATLVNERLSAGAHTYNFDASQLSSGVYIYRLQAENQTITKRMTLIK
jgi:hypothetical protein